MWMKMKWLMSMWKTKIKKSKLLCTPCLPPTRLLRQLTTFYNPVDTNYIQEADSNDNTVATRNQLGREGADAAKPNPEANLDVSLKAHDLQEDGFSDTNSKIHDLKEDVLLNKQASAAINYLPNFAFYMRNQVLAPASEAKTLDFEDVLNTTYSNPQCLMKHTTMMIPNSMPSGMLPSGRSSRIWTTVECCGARSSSQSSHMAGTASSPKG